MIKALFLGILSSFFFAVTFVLNRQMQIAGGHWLWTSSLRFVFMLPVLFVMVLPKTKYKKVFKEIKRNKFEWFIWSTVGFGIFYSFLCMASSYGPSWMTASTWQVTIIAGILLTPLISRERHKIPIKQLIVGLVILVGVILVQAKKGSLHISKDEITGIFFIVIAAFAYPLGNRKMMHIVSTEMSTIERVFGMTLCSMPFWIVLMATALVIRKLPTTGQIIQSIIVALSSGVIATILFFKATELVKYNAKKLAVVESTQAGEVVFSLFLGLVLFNDQLPSGIALVGIGIIISGIILSSVLTDENLK